ncbi:hypothetical protein D3C80_1026700 [compost metagenome]
MEFIFKKGSGFKLKIGRTAFLTLLAAIELLSGGSNIKSGVGMASEVIIEAALWTPYGKP